MELTGQTNFTRGWYNQTNLTSSQSRLALINIVFEVAISLLNVYFLKTLIRGQVWRLSSFFAFLISLSFGDMGRCAFYLVFNVLVLCGGNIDEWSLSQRAVFAVNYFLLIYATFISRLFVMSSMSIYRFCAVCIPLQFRAHESFQKVVQRAKFYSTFRRNLLRHRWSE